MKQIILFFFVLTYSNSIISQSEISGTYQLEFKGNVNLKRTLILNTDGTFSFHNYEYHENGIPPEKNSFGKGTWKSENKRVYFYTSKTDLDEKHTLNFNNTKARFIIKSPRDKSNRLIKTALRFYESDIFWIKGMTLIKGK